MRFYGDYRPLVVSRQLSLVELLQLHTSDDESARMALEAWRECDLRLGDVRELIAQHAAKKKVKGPEIRTPNTPSASQPNRRGARRVRRRRRG